MIYINEWLPNPAGRDTEGEWLELYNVGAESVNLHLWRLENSAQKKFFLSGEVEPYGYLVIKKPELKLTLKNQDEGLSLYDSSGKLIHHSSYKGTAPEGKGLSRFALPSFSEKNLGGQERFVFAETTPGAENRALTANILNNSYPEGQLPNSSLANLGVFGMALGIGLLFVFLLIFILKRNESFQKLVTGRDQEIR